MLKKGGWVLPLLGGLGGLIGALPGGLLFFDANSYTRSVQGFLFLSLYFYVTTSPVTFLTGAAIGAIIWRWQAWTGRHTGVILRAVIGAILAGSEGFIWAYGFYVSAHNAGYGNAFNPALIKYGIIVGAVAGIFVYPQVNQNQSNN